MNIHEAVKSGDLEAVKAALAEGADIESREDENGWGTTPLMMAARGHHLDVFNLLIENGANPNATDNSGLTALDHVFVSRLGVENAEKIRDFLLQEGVSFNYENLFAFLDEPEMLRLSIQKGAKLDQVNEYTGLTPLGQAVKGHNYEAAQILIENGADANARDQDVLNHWGMVEKAGHNNPILNEAATHSSPRMAELLIKGGADVNATSAGGYSALQVAAGRGLTEVVKALLQAGADPKLGGSDVASLAESRGYTETAQAIRNHRQ